MMSIPDKRVEEIRQIIAREDRLEYRASRTWWLVGRVIELAVPEGSVVVRKEDLFELLRRAGEEQSIYETPYDRLAAALEDTNAE